MIVLFTEAAVRFNMMIDDSTMKIFGHVVNQNGVLAQFINKFSGSCDQNIYINRVKTS